MYSAYFEADKISLNKRPPSPYDLLHKVKNLMQLRLQTDWDCCDLYVTLHLK